MSTKNQKYTTETSSSQGGVIEHIVVLSHKLREVEVLSFDWISGYGWTFNWYENQREKKIDCLTYGLFPSDFVQVNGNHQFKIESFLKNQSKKDEVPISKVISFINAS